MRKIRRRLRRGRPEVKFLNVMLLVIAVALIIVGVSRLGSEDRAESTEVLAKHVERTTTTVPRDHHHDDQARGGNRGERGTGRNDRDDRSEPEAEVEASPRNHDDHRSVPRGRVGIVVSVPSLIQEPPPTTRPTPTTTRPPPTTTTTRPAPPTTTTTTMPDPVQEPPTP